MLRDAPTTVAPISRNRRVMKDPRPPFAPVMKTTLSFMNPTPPQFVVTGFMQLPWVAHLLLMYLVFLFHSRPPDNVQAVRPKQESGAGLIVRNFLTNLLHLIDALGFT